MMKVKKINFEKLALVFFSLIFYQKFGGGFFSFLPVTAYAILTLIISLVASRTSKLLKNKWFLLIWLFLFIMSMSLLWTNAPLYGMQKIISITFTILLFYVIYPILHKNFSFFLVLNFIFYVLYLFNLYLEYGFISQLSDMLNNRFRLGWDDEGSALNPIGIARYLVFSILNIGFYIFTVRNNYISKKILTSILLLFIFIGITYLFFSGTKTPILAGLIATFLYIFINQKVPKKHKLLIILSPITLFFIYSSINLSGLNTISQKQMDFIEYRYFNTDAAVSDRSYQSERALSKVSFNTLIFGAGTGDFGYLYTQKDIRDYPHNVFAEVLYENGIINIVILLILFTYVLSLTRRNASLPLAYFIVLFYYFLVNAFFSGDLINNNLLFGFMLFIVLEQHKIKKLYKGKI